MQHFPSASSEKSTPELPSGAIPAVVLMLFSCLFAGLALQSVLENPQLASSFCSLFTWQEVVTGILGGELIAEVNSQGQPEIQGAITSLPLNLLLVLSGQVLFLLPVLMVDWRRGGGRLVAIIRRMAGWWGLSGVWGIMWLVALLGPIPTLAGLLQGTVVFWGSLTVAGLLYEVLGYFLIPCSQFGTTPEPSGTGKSVGVEPGTETLREDDAETVRQRRLAWRGVLVLMGIYVVVFTAMNWGLWFNLRLPHGDSAMYEEHLWNVLHGKGFRSYLDQGLFWGEHIQFVHLFLLPLYVLWPSHLLLELCESLVLAAGAIPVFWLARRAGGSDKAALWLSAAYLLYFPLQFLDIAVDLKTFRPIAFGVAPVLLAIDQIERKNYRWASLWLLFSLTCKEDYAIVVFSVGLVLVAQWVWPRLVKRILPGRDVVQSDDARLWQYGLGYMVFGPVYLLAALKAIRWFRSGVEVHYAGYFTRFGDSTGEIIWNMLTDPSLLLGELLTGSSLIYVLALFVPLGFLPFRAPIKLLGCLPMLVLLCLNELAQDPRHHFHAPIIPLIFWAAASSLRRGKASAEEKDSSQKSWGMEAEPRFAERWALWAGCCAWATTVWFSMSPLGVAFWDPGSSWNGLTLYWPDERARMFAKVEPLIPDNARVASTDYVHPRLTHRERSYDYSNYARKVSGYELTVPADTEYIVIDTRHPYSTIQSVDQIREMQEEPEQWEVLPDETNGYYIVLKRRAASAGK